MSKDDGDASCSDDEYISLASIKSNWEGVEGVAVDADEYYDKDLELDESGELVYQVQSQLDPTTNDCLTCIMAVGRFMQVPNILIHRFDLNHNVRCLIVSELYNQKDLIEAAKVCRLNIIKIAINKVQTHRKEETLTPVGCILLSFNTFDHKVKNRDIIEYVSKSKESTQALQGFWAVSFHFKDKMTVLEKCKSYTGTKSMIDNMIRHLNNSTVRDIVDSLVQELG